MRVISQNSTFHSVYISTLVLLPLETFPKPLHSTLFILVRIRAEIAE